MDMALIWRQFFTKWPQGLPQRGVVVTSFDEQIAFANFMLSEHMILLNEMRRTRWEAARSCCLTRESRRSKSSTRSTTRSSPRRDLR